MEKDDAICDEGRGLEDAIEEMASTLIALQDAHEAIGAAIRKLAARVVEVERLAEVWRS